MINSISQSLSPSSALQTTKSTDNTQASDSSFKNMLLDSIQEVNSAQLEADKAVENMFSGGDTNPAEVLTAVQKADLAFRMMMQVRNKLVQAYQEVKDIRI
jgi:flagellar hook-basal body complex protein FliE